MHAMIVAWVCTCIFGSFFEWGMHKYFMHNVYRLHFRLFEWAFERHVKTHHHNRRPPTSFFGPDTYHLGSSNIIYLLLLFLFLAIMVGYLSGLWAGLGAALGAVSYIGWYELQHFLMHT